MSNHPLIDKNGIFINDIVLRESKSYDTEFININKNNNISEKKYFSKLAINKKKDYINIVRKLKDSSQTPKQFIILESNMNNNLKYY